MTVPTAVAESSTTTLPIIVPPSMETLTPVGVPSFLSETWTEDGPVSVPPLISTSIGRFVPCCATDTAAPLTL